MLPLKKLKKLSFIFSLLTVCSFFIFPKVSFARELILSPDTKTINKGEEYEVHIKIEGIKFLDRIKKVIANVKYNNNVLQYDRMEKKGFFSDNGWLYTITPNEGDVDIIVSMQSGTFFSGESEMITIYFKAINDGSAQVYSHDSAVYDFLSCESDIQSNSVSVTVLGPVSTPSPDPANTNVLLTSQTEAKEFLYAVTLQVDNVVDLAGFSTDINYDKDILEYSYAEPGEFFSSEGCEFESSLKQDGTVYLAASCFGADSINGNTELATVYFKALGSDITEITYTDNNLYNSNSEAVSVNWQPVIFVVGVQTNNSDTTPPQIFDDGSSPQKLYINTDEDSFCRYSTSAGALFPDMSVFEITGNKIHSSNIDNFNENGEYAYYIKCQDISGNTSSDFVLIFSKQEQDKNDDNGSSGGGNSGTGGGSAGTSGQSSGGGGGGAVIYPTADNSNSSVGLEDNKIGTGEIKKATSTIMEINTPVKSEKVGIAKVEIAKSNYKTVAHLAGLERDLVEKISAEEAKVIFAQKQQIIMSKEAAANYNKIMRTDKEKLNNSILAPIMAFIQNGTDTTKRLGAGERAGVVNSYAAAFGEFPKSEADWKNVIKIANGRWPAGTSAKKEAQANSDFKKIYLRAANRKNVHDDAAIMLASYGLRPAQRNLSAEKSAMKIFKAIYSHNAEKASEWDIVRAIAYSGAVR